MIQNQAGPMGLPFAQLADPQSLLRQLLLAGTDSVYAKDRHGRYLFANQAHARFMGQTAADGLCGRTSREISDSELGRQLHERDIAFLAGEQLVGHIQKVVDSPAGMRCSVHSIRVRCGGATPDELGLVCIQSISTPQAQSPQALFDEHSLLRALIDNIPDHIYAKDLQSRFILINKAVAENIGISSPEEILGKTDFDFFPRHLAAQYFEDELKVLNSGTPLVSREEQTCDSHGNLKWLSSTKIPFRDSQGRIAGLVGVNRDIHSRKQFEEALTRAKAELEVRVQERTADLQEANQGLELRIRQLDYLTRASYELSRYIALRELIPAILQAFAERFAGAEACICKRSGNRYECMGATAGLDSEDGRQFAEAALQALGSRKPQKPLIVADWRLEPWLAGLGWPGPAELPCEMIIPLLADNHTVGVVLVFAPAVILSQFDQEKQLLKTLAAHAAVCLVNAYNYKALGEQARVQAELDAARTIQLRLTPRFKPRIPHVNLKGVYYPVFEVGGDYLDYFQNDNGEWIVVVADVCGKGIPAALLMTTLRSTVRAEARRCSSARDLLNAVNLAMASSLNPETFITALVLVIDPTGTSMSYARAGHPLLIRFGAHQQPAKIACGGMALGIVPDCAVFRAAAEELTIALQPGDKFLLYTDGLFEATDEKKNAYGLGQLLTCLERNCSLDADRLAEAVMSDVRAFIKAEPLRDDYTLIALEVV